MQVTQIVPRLPPAIDGLGDYALNIATRLHDEYGIKSRFVVGDPTWLGRDNVGGFPVACLAEQSAAIFFKSLINSEPSQVILLHYVGYGYAKRGTPLWLLSGLERWRKFMDEARILIMFHEIYAKGPIWTSSFWLSPLQKYVAARLTQLSDVCLTNRLDYSVILRSLSGGKHIFIATLPVFSNIGEPKDTPPTLKDRNRRMVIFGGRGNRARVYERSRHLLERACRALNIREVVDIGPSIDYIPTRINDIPLMCMGELPAKEISSLLLDSLAGFFDYNTAFLAKSGIYAAYSSHGMLPISANCDGKRADGLEAYTHYWVVNNSEKPLDLAVGQKIADNAYYWYQGHKLAKHAQALAKGIIDAKRSSGRENYSWIT